MTVTWSLFIYGAIILTVCVFFIAIAYKYIKRLLYIINFPSYISVLEYHMDKAYDLIHKDKILAYSLDAFRIPDDEYEKLSHDFVVLVRKYIGPSLLKEFVQLYGNEEAFIFIILDYFSRKYENDEIRKTALDNLTQEE